MKIFPDTANIEEFSKYSYIIDGVTTNPTLMAQEKHGSYVITIPQRFYRSCSEAISPILALKDF